MDYQALKALIQTHPSWPGVDDATLAVWVNEEAISVDRDTIPANEAYAVIARFPAEYRALSDADKRLLDNALYLSVSTGIPTSQGHPIRDLLVSILGNQTKAALASAISHQVSRAANVGIHQAVSQDHVAHAKTV